MAEPIPQRPALPTGQPALVVGGGLVGLSAAVLLAWHGVDTVLIERRAGPSTHPRARGLNPRTMEIFRQVGLEQAIRACPSARALAANTGILAAESLAGRELGALTQSYYAGDNATDFGWISPTSWCLCHQAEVEPVLREAAESLGADVRFSTELIELSCGPDGAVGVLRGRDGETLRLRSPIVIAADGAGSPLRRQFGIAQHGAGTLGHFMNVQFRADLRAPLAGRRFVLCYTLAGGLRAALLPIDNGERWLLHVPVQPGQESRFNPEHCVELVRLAAGMPDLDVAVEGVAGWESAAWVADRFRAGPVLLAGDAAHVMPPSGAFGVNTGIQDVHNLAWKLRAVLTGRAAPELLDTYDCERRPVAVLTADQAVRRSRDRPRLAHKDAEAPDPAIVPDPQVIFCCRYPVTTHSGPGSDVHAADADANTHTAVLGWVAELTGEPGTRVPHIELPGPAGPVSTVDLVGRQPILLTGPDADGWQQAATAVGLVAHRGDPRLCTAARIGPSGALLVRPDAVVADRWVDPPDAPAAVLPAAINKLMGWRPAPVPK